MKWKFGGLLLLMLLIAAAAYWARAVGKRESKSTPGKFNVLIVSVCSLRAGNLGLYGYGRDTSPRLDSFAKNAFVFDNAFTDRSWSNLLGFLTELSDGYLAEHGYEGIGEPFKDYQLRNIGVAEARRPAPFFFQLPAILYSNRDTNFMWDIERLRERLKIRREKRFVLEVHSKFVHLPYSPPLGEEIDIGTGIRGSGIKALEFLSDEQKKDFAALTGSPEKNSGRIPALLMLSQNEKAVGFLKTLPRVQRAIKDGLFLVNGGITSWMAWIVDPLFTAAWRASRTFKADVSLIEAVYDSRIKFHDWAIAPLFELFGEEELRKNTVVIFTGDHGEAFNEHGYVGHGDQVYDEALRFPLVIRFPGMKGSVRVKRQIYQGILGDIVKGIIEGRVHAGNLLAFIEALPENDTIVARNCQNTELAVRYQNEWKLITNKLDNSRSLFHLPSDPLESTNVISANPGIAAKLEEKMLDPAWQTRYPNRMLQSCEP